MGIYLNMEDAIRARKSAEKEVFGNFLKWYQETYPEQWERIQKSQEKKALSMSAFFFLAFPHT